MHRKTETFLTIAELSELSTFKLPNGRRIPAVSVKQIRVLERRGLYDDPNGCKMRGDDFPLVLWRRKPTLPGKPRLYTGLDLACTRLAGWMRAEGLGWTSILSVLRGRWSARYVMAGTQVLAERDKELYVMPDGVGAIVRTDEIERMASQCPAVHALCHRFPLAWLNMTGGTLPAVELDRVRDVAFELSRWRDVPAELAALELARAKNEGNAAK